MILIALVTKLLWILLSTATKTEIITVIRVSSSELQVDTTSSVCSMVTGIIVKSAHDHDSVLYGLAFLSIYRNLCVTVAVSSLGTNLSTSLLVSGVSRHHLVVTATSSSWSSVTSVGSSSRHVERRTQSRRQRNLLREGCGAGAHCCQEKRSQKVACFCQFCF